MKFRNNTTEASALAFACLAVGAVCGMAFRLIAGHWPSPGFWLSGVVVYFVVVFPSIRRHRRKADDGSPDRPVPGR